MIRTLAPQIKSPGFKTADFSYPLITIMYDTLKQVFHTRQSELWRSTVVLCVRGVASNEAEEAVASSLLCARTRARIGTSMREVNYITMTDLTRTINRGWAALITTFFT